VKPSQIEQQMTGQWDTWVTTTIEVSTATLERFAAAIHTVIGRNVDVRYALRNVDAMLTAAAELAVARSLETDRRNGQTYRELHATALRHALHGAAFPRQTGRAADAINEGAETAAWAHVEEVLRSILAIERTTP